jgi:uncharacterized repeat protein (TIGR03803 family)
MTSQRFLGFPRAASFVSRGLLPTVLLSLILCLGTPSQECAGSEFQVLRQFTNEDGAHPFCDLVRGSDGAHYGTTVTGNNSTDYDAIFKMNPDGSGFTVLMNFDSPTTGGNCWGGLLLGSDGALYGTTYYGGTGSAGTVFKINQDGTGFAVLKNFVAATTGGASYARLLEVDEVLYGTTYTGGNGNAGTVFKLNLDGSGFTVLKHFDNSTTGGHPTSGLILGPDGALYGAAFHGGSFLSGTIFKLNADGSSFSVLKHLNVSVTGGYPAARLLRGSDDELYGSTSEGGSLEVGTIFTIHPDGSGFRVLKNLHRSTEGAFPSSGLIEADNGKLYGTTLNGGTYDRGTVFQMKMSGEGYRVLKRIDNSTTGYFLYGGLMQGTDGALYGAAAYGGDEDFGTLFRVVPGPNGAPTAVAGQDQEIHAGTPVDLNGSASFDDDCTSAFLTYAWSFSSRPEGSTAALSNADTVMPSFTADRMGTYVVQLIVTDNDGLSSAADAVEISSVNQAPTAVATADFTEVVAGDPVSFDGSNSTDPDIDELTYAWTLTTVPRRSQAALADANTAYPTLVPDQPGQYKVRLTVTDPFGASGSVTIIIFASPPVEP